MGEIGVRGLRIECVVGVRKRERKHTQLVEIDVVLAVDVRAAARRDALHDAVDYTEVVSVLTRVAQDGRFNLIETLADGAATALLQSFPAVESVTLEVRKPSAIANAEHAFARVVRGR